MTSFYPQHFLASLSCRFLLSLALRDYLFAGLAGDLVKAVRVVEGMTMCIDDLRCDVLI